MLNRINGKMNATSDYKQKFMNLIFCGWSIKTEEVKEFEYNDLKLNLSYS